MGGGDFHKQRKRNIQSAERMGSCQDDSSTNTAATSLLVLEFYTFCSLPNWCQIHISWVTVRHSNISLVWLAEHSNGEKEEEEKMPECTRKFVPSLLNYAVAFLKHMMKLPCFESDSWPT